MSGFYGADTEALRDLAARFQDGERRLGDLRVSLSSMVMDEAIWVGSDADAFRGSWSSEASPRLGAIAERVGATRTDLDHHAEEQDTASEPGDGSGGSFWDTVGDLVKIGAKAFGLYKAGTSILSGIDDMKRLWDMYKLGPDDFSRAWESLKLRNKMTWVSEGFGKLFKTLGGQFGKAIPGDVWKWMGKQVDGFPTKLAEGGSLVEKIGAKLGPEGLEVLGKSSKALGKVLPGVDLLVGAHQVATADDGYGKTSGVLSMAGGALMLAGIAFPPLAAVGGVLSGVSLAMDLVDLGGELFGADPSKAVSQAVSDGLSSVGDALGGIGRGLGSIFG